MLWSAKKVKMHYRTSQLPFLPANKIPRDRCCCCRLRHNQNSYYFWTKQKATATHVTSTKWSHLLHQSSYLALSSFLFLKAFFLLLLRRRRHHTSYRIFKESDIKYGNNNEPSFTHQEEIWRLKLIMQSNSRHRRKRKQQDHPRRMMLIISSIRKNKKGWEI